MSTKVPVKSILKQKQQAALPTEADTNRKNLSLALYHANLIQAQKDVQAQILASIERLSELPNSARFTPEEAKVFTTLVHQFQPSDLDALIEERSIDSRCGYTLCANSPRSKTLGAHATWKLSSGAVDYCSDLCARKNLYVKTQLGEIPAWERQPGLQPAIVLHEDYRPAASSQPAVAAQPAKWKKTAADDKDLAAERGDTMSGFRPKQVMTDSIVEKRNTGPRKTVVSFQDPDASHTLIEGYEPKTARQHLAAQDDSDEDI